MGRDGRERPVKDEELISQKTDKLVFSAPLAFKLFTMDLGNWF